MRIRRPRAGIVLAILLLLGLAALIQVRVVGPRVTVTWAAAVDEPHRLALERQYELRNARPGDGPDWSYELRDTSRANVEALVHDRAVADTAYINRDRYTVDARRVQVTVRYPYSDLFSRPSDLLKLHRSLWLLLAGGFLLWAARAPDERRRRNVALATLLIVGVLAVALPFSPSFVTMGGSADHTKSSAAFLDWFGGRVRFEKHLAQITLLEIYNHSGSPERAPERAVVAMSRIAVAWFLLSALTIGVLERWSALSLRYIGLVLMAPSALLYFGWREFGYLSLTAAAFPLLMRGLMSGDFRLEMGSAFAGLGAALHGSGLVSLAGAGLAALGAPRQFKERMDRLFRLVAWVTAAYLGWIAIYIIVLKMEIRPDPQAAQISGWRPLFMDEVRERRLAAAIFSATGARDLLMSAWIVGAPLIAVAASLWRRYPAEVRMALWYLPPSILFVIFRWPFDGIGGGMDLVVAGFPALYALAWVCAHDSKRATIAAAFLASAHYAFWRVVLDERFRP